MSDEGQTQNIEAVSFRVFPEGDVIAIFINDEYAGPGNGLSSYQHVGQHGGCSYDLLHELRPASKDEYMPLLKELKSIGYHNLEIV